MTARKYIVTPREQIGLHNNIVAHNDWNHSFGLGVYVTSIPVGGHKRRQPSIHATEWGPYVQIAAPSWEPNDESCTFLNARAARLLARYLLEAADRAEEIEFELGWHPSQVK